MSDPFIEKLIKLGVEMQMDNQPRKSLEVGDKIELFGGYDYDPLYLENPASSNRIGKVTRFIKGQNDELAAVVKLENSISGKSSTGNVLVLELRWEGQNWLTTGPVHIELCNFEPEDKPWKERVKGEWMEAAASFKIIP